MTFKFVSSYICEISDPSETIQTPAFIQAPQERIFTDPSSQVDFSTDGRELTPTMKMARHAVLKKYAAEVCTNPLPSNASKSRLS